MRNIKMQLLLALTGLFFLSGCGGETEKFVKEWVANEDQQTFKLSATFNPSYRINGEATIDYKDYGTIRIGQNSNDLFSVDLMFNYDIAKDNDLESTRSLPTGIRFPSIIKDDLLQAPVYEDPGKWSVISYFGFADNSISYSGLAVELESIDNSFPNLSITQNYFNENDVKYASFTIYGPEKNDDNEVVTPGGIFVVGDMDILLGGSSQKVLQAKAADTSIEVRGPKADEYQSKEARQKLMKRFLEDMEDDGVIEPRK